MTTYLAYTLTSSGLPMYCISAAVLSDKQRLLVVHYYHLSLLSPITISVICSRLLLCYSTLISYHSCISSLCNTGASQRGIRTTVCFDDRTDGCSTTMRCSHMVARSVRPVGSSFPTPEMLQSNSELTVAADERCFTKLDKEIKDNVPYFDEIREQVDNANIMEAYEIVEKKAEELCTVEQVNRLKALFEKYNGMKEDIQELAPEYSIQERRKVLEWIKEKNFFALSQFIVQQGMKSIFNSPKRFKLMDISLQLTAMEMEMVLNPI